MHRVVAAFISVLLAFAVSAPPAAAQPAVAPAAGGDAIAKAYVLVDADTGNILDAHNETALLPPASITKLLTALTVLARMDPSDEITIQSTKPESMPALKIGVKQGETWTVDRLLHGLLMVSANDAAVALAEGSTGSLDNFVAARAQAAKDLGLSDNPVFNDPAGLDDAAWGYNGGDQVSARDMAIIARAALANDEIRSIVSSQRYDFTGLDGLPHHFLNHNGMLKTYSGAIGMKTGYTQRAGKTLVAAAQRDGRTMLTVLLNAPNINASAAALMDQGFATPVASEPTAGALPTSSVQPVHAAKSLAAATSPAADALADGTQSAGPLVRVLGAAFVAVLALLALLRVRSVLYVRRPSS